MTVYQYIFKASKLAVSSIAALLFLWQMPSVRADSSNVDAAATAVSLLTKLEEKWASIETLKYDVETKDTESEDFKKSINETNHDRDVLLTHLTFMLKGTDYGWKTDTFIPATGTHIRVSSGGLTNGTLSVLFAGQESLLMVTKNPSLQSAIPITGCNPVMEAFSFLVSDDWQGFNCPTVQLNSLLSPDTWASAAKRVTSVSVEQLRTQPCIKIVFGQEAGSHDVVYFPKDMGGFPVDWQHYQGAYLRREVVIGDMMVKVLPNGESIKLPHLITRRDFYDPANPNVFCTSEQTMSFSAINQPIDDEDLIIDPSLADAIYDRDNDKRITVPK